MSPQVANTFVAVNILNAVIAAICYAAAKQWNPALYWAAAAVLTGTVLWRSWA